MIGEVRKTPKVLIGGNVSSQPAFGAYSGDDGMSLTREVVKRTPYSLLEKTGRIEPKPTPAVMDANNRWLRELGITSADRIDFEKAWETNNFRRQKSEHEWRDTYGGKLAIRTFSRGILGSVFFVAGQHIAGAALKNYAFDPLDASKNSALHNPLEYAARLVDKTLGAGIYKAALVAARGDKAKAANVVTFRHTNHWKAYGKGADGHDKGGRSYGHEGLAITFDFGLASLGDYLGRSIAGLIDPNTEKKWMKDGHIDIPQATKALLKSVWTGVSKAAGEDYFAMATGYPYVVRGTRNLISKFSPGFEHDSDRWANGGSFKIDGDKIVGNYQLEGMTDLALRFSAYNVQTKIFRDGYDKISNQFKHFWDGDRTIHLPHLDAIPTPASLAKKAGDGISAAALYLTRTTLKVALYMIPSSAIFAFIRSSQSKDIGLAIDPKHGPVGVMKDGEWTPIFTNGAAKSDGKRSDFPITENTHYLFKKDDTNAKFCKFAPHKTKGYETRFDAFAQTTEDSKWHDRFTNPMGRFCNQGGHALTEVIKPFARAIGGKNVDIGAISKHSQRFVDATMCYTPYFMAKTDVLSTALDRPTTDMALDRGIKGAAHLNWGEFKAGFGEVIRTLEGRPFADPNREAEAQKRMRTHADQLWSSQDEIIAKEREEEYQQRMDAALSLGKPISMTDLYRRPFADRVGRRTHGRPVESSSQDSTWSPHDSYYTQTITPLPKKSPEEYKKSQDSTAQQPSTSWGQRAMRDFENTQSSQGQTIN